jgi:hypothetical protein
MCPSHQFDQHEQPTKHSSDVARGIVLFFIGDYIQQAGSHPDVTRLQQPSSIIEALQKRFPGSDILVIAPSRYEGGCACYDNFLDGKWDLMGEPMRKTGGYQGTSLKAVRQLYSIVRNAYDQLDLSVSAETVEHESKPLWRPVYVVGFSKGGVVLNQLLTDIGTKGLELRNRQGDDELLYSHTSKFNMLLAIRQVHYLDVGLNCPGAYLTDIQTLENLGSFLEMFHKPWEDKGKCCPFEIGLHGTLRQWGGKDTRSKRLIAERDAMIHGCKAAGINIYMKLYAYDRCEDPRLAMREHFKCIEYFSN